MVTDYKGNSFNTVDDMVEHYNINKNTYKARRRAGWSLRDALITPADVHEGIKVDHLGREYHSMAELCEKYGIPDNLLRWRLEQGWSLERALTTPNSSNKKAVQDHLGNQFESLKQMLEHYKIPKYLYFKRLDSGWSLEKILTTAPSTKNKKKYSVLGCPPMSVPDMIEYFHSHIKYNTLHKRLKSGMDVITALICPDKVTSIKRTHTGVFLYEIQGLCGELTTRDMVCRYRPDLIVLYDRMYPDNIGMYLDECEVI